MSLLERLKSEIISKLCAKNVNLVRFHDKNFNKTGDLSFPCLGNKKVWCDNDLCDKNLEELLNEMETIRILKILSNEKSVCVWLDRKHAFKKYFSDNSKSFINTESTHETIKVCDNLQEDLTSERVRIYAHMLAEVMKRSKMEDLCCYEVGIQSKTFEGENKSTYLQVGAVLGETGKKESQSIHQFSRKVFEDLESQDSERREEEENEADQQARLEALTRAQVRFSLTASSPANQLKINNKGREAVFLLYNCARVVQILYSFEQSVKDGVYPTLPDVVDYTLLDTQEEWELLFVYILPYKDVLRDAVLNGKLHRIPIHLIGLSNCLSRYYSRVKVLRDPLPSTLPTMYARIRFLSHIHDIILDGLEIMGLTPLKKL